MEQSSCCYTVGPCWQPLNFEDKIVCVRQGWVQGPNVIARPTLRSFNPEFWVFSHSSHTHSLCFSILVVVFVAQSCPTLWDPMDYGTLGFPVLHCLLEFAQTHVHWIGDAIQPSHPLSPSSPVLNLSQRQRLFQWISSSHQVAKLSELQLQHQSFQWIFRVDFL